ncbi:hypothetical protein [Pseudomonas sp. NPDC090201]|uniref:hypothetical protein n=1 Tax=Pseudomonas sp. NPDC090201 TaxID=3364475 RepID=UPI003815CE2A
MRKWFLILPLVILAIRGVAIELLERYSKVQVCEAVGDRGRFHSLGCAAFDQVLAGQYRVIEGEVYWVRSSYAREYGCGTGAAAMVANPLSFKCWMQWWGYARTEERRSYTYVETLTPAFKVLEPQERNLLDWQKERFNNYAVGELGVYRYGKRVEGADPKDFSIIFPLGDQKHWRSLDISRSGKTTFIGGDSLGEVDLTQFRLIESSDCKDVKAGCTAQELAGMLDTDSGVVGAVDNDVVILRRHDSLMVKNKASPGMYAFARGDNRYVHTQGVLYQDLTNQYSYVSETSYDPVKVVGLRPVYQPRSQHSQKYPAWQQEQFLKYGVTDEGVYFNRQRLKDADPKNFEVVFPFGSDARWENINLSKSGKALFVGGKRFENADFGKFEVVRPCKTSEEGVTNTCWTLDDVANSAKAKGVVAQLGEDFFLLHPSGVRRFIGAASCGSYVFERRGELFLSSGGQYTALRNAFGVGEVYACVGEARG